MALCTETYFPGGVATTEARLAALNLTDTSSAGGLRFPGAVVKIPKGAIILRLFLPAAAGERDDFGPWWFTPYEYKRISDYFGVSSDVLAVGRSGGRSALHGALALLSEWYGGGTGAAHTPSAGQISRYHVARLVEPIHAMYGEGDDASTRNYGRVLKPLRMPDAAGGLTAARQLYLHKPWEYKGAFKMLTASSGDRTDSDLPGAIARLGVRRLPFE